MRSFLFIALLVVATTAASATTAPLNVAAWRADLDTLERELPIRHPAPFANVPRVRGTRRPRRSSGSCPR